MRVSSIQKMPESLRPPCDIDPSHGAAVAEVETEVDSTFLCADDLLRAATLDHFTPAVVDGRRYTDLGAPRQGFDWDNASVIGVLLLAAVVIIWVVTQIA